MLCLFVFVVILVWVFWFCLFVCLNHFIKGVFCVSTVFVCICIHVHLQIVTLLMLGNISVVWHFIFSVVTVLLSIQTFSRARLRTIICKEVPEIRFSGRDFWWWSCAPFSHNIFDLLRAQAGLDLHVTWGLIIGGGQHCCLSCVRNCVCTRIWDHGEERRDGYLGNWAPPWGCGF